MILACTTCGARNRLPAARLTDKGRCAQCKTPIAPVAVPLDVNSASEFQELLEHCPSPVLVDFWASWCAPCRTVAPELKKVAAQKVGQVVVAKVNTEEFNELARRHHIEGIPCMILFEAGKERQRISGARPAGAIIAALGI